MYTSALFKCAIIDDEPKAAELLHHCLLSLYKTNCEATLFYNWEQALPAIKNEHFDIIFMDISMPEKNGIEILSLVPNLTAEVIFVTAHSEYAIKSFKFFPSGYMLKPIDDIELFATVNKAIERISVKSKSTPAPTNVDNKIGISSGKGIDYVDIDAIYFLEGFQSYTKVFTKTGDIMSSNSIGRFFAILEKSSFLQIHRSYIVNPKYIKKYLIKGAVVMENDAEIPVSRNYKDDLMKLFNKVTKEEI